MPTCLPDPRFLRRRQLVKLRKPAIKTMCFQGNIIRLEDMQAQAHALRDLALIV